jgi:ABC-type spermidine/putrescine transport system permease subunit I
MRLLTWNIQWGRGVDGGVDIDRATIEAARNLGASRLRCLVEIVIPQIARTLMVGLVLSFVTMLSVLSVPLMVAGSQPTMLTVAMAFRINSYSDYPVANALGVISYLMMALAAWIYLRHSVAEDRGGR